MASTPPPPPPPPPPPDPNVALVAEAARLTAQAAVATADTARINAEAARAAAAAAKEKAAIEGLGLPSFEGKTTLNAGAGAIEALILATDAVARAGQTIADEALRLEWPRGTAYKGDFLLLAGDEAADFGPLESVRAQIATFAELFAAALDGQQQSPLAMIEGVAGSIAAVTAIAGLFRSETTVTPVDHDKIDHRVLAIAVAGRMQGRALLPGSVRTALPKQAPPIVKSLMKLVDQRDQVAGLASGHPAPEVGDRLKAAVTRFDAFFERITTPDASGVVALAKAAHLEQMLGGQALALRVYLEKAGGSLINRKNIVTFFGGDPVRVSGGLVASFTITDPSDGRVLAARVLNCRTSIGKLREIQAGP